MCQILLLGFSFFPNKLHHLLQTVHGRPVACRPEVIWQGWSSGFGAPSVRSAKRCSSSRLSGIPIAILHTLYKQRKTPAQSRVKPHMRVSNLSLGGADCLEG